ncbi:TlpA disulfide reductase family protein [Chitinophaga sp. sic0106]|uniref:TlpA disulfide reductase family protein n=1 Tax=Chitinophaga sp. sic0106 TaxID=2854785 RepID=UPI001C49340D|nr:TlpA disulfide reductase family protein [Chitinophaga sp. sic0106]MBV7531023.1 redoxin domain-containing protein [Chitinophaga sp. sic0106]
MNRIFLGLALMAGLSASAQQKKMLELDVKIKGLINGDIVQLWGPLTSTIDTAYVKDDHFHYSLDMSKGGSTYILQVGNRGKESEGTFLYLEAGTMNITGNGPYFQNATYTGSQFVTDWMDINDTVLKGDSLLSEKDAAQQRMIAATQIGDQEAKDEAYAEYQRLQQKDVEASLAWLKKHPNSGAGSYLINAYLAQGMGKKELVDLIESLGPNLRNTFTINKMMTGTIGGGSAMADLLNKPAPAFKLSNAAGKPVSLADFKGKYVVLDFWASWCKPCRAAIPELTSVYNQYKSKGLEVLSVSLDDKKDKWLQALDEEKMAWPQVSDLKGGAGEVPTQYGVVAIPACFLIDPSGKVIMLGASGERLKQKLAELMK